MGGLQRSQISFRRTGSSGLVWEDNKFVSGELNKTISVPSKNEQRATSASAPVGEAHKGYRASNMDDDFGDPPSPRVSTCGLCGLGKPAVDSKNRKLNTHPSYRPT